MYEQPEDFLMMYDREYIEQHDESSDFEEHCIPLIAPKKGNHSLFRHKQIKKISDLYIDCDEYPVKLRDTQDYDNEIKVNKEKETRKTEKKQKSKRKHTTLNCGDQVGIARSKLSIIRQKVVPCLSSLFKRSNNSTKHMAVIEENQVENTLLDNSCQQCTNCERRRKRKLYKRENYAVQPVFAIEGNVHKTARLDNPTKTEPLQNHNRKKSKNQYSSCSPSSSSESETQCARERQLMKKKLKKRFRTEIIQEHFKYQQNQQFKNRQLQYPSKEHKNPYQIFTTPYQSRSNVSPDSDGQYGEMPASSSSFWDYLFDKMNRKYFTQRVEMPKACQCSSGTRSPCSPSNCQNFEAPPEPSCCKSRQQSSPSNACPCKGTFASSKEQTTSGGCCQKDFVDLLSQSPSPTSIKKKLQEKKVQCKCYDNGKQKRDSLKTQKVGPQAVPDSKPCQEGHDEITTTLAEKYNGEILCIHNPPCILINGCLNLPPQKEQSPQMSLWPVSETKKPSFYDRKKKKKSNRTQACQYHIPYVDVQQCQTPEYRTEKQIQSICPHDPPCEVVRGCYKPKYDPNLRNSCVHVPMCKKIPECVVGRVENTRSCQHRPRCPEIPMCSRNNYVVLTAKENVGTQVKPNESFVCRHMPSCVMIPKCLGKTMYDTYVPVEAVPDCIHQPSCDMIPACCRKSSKEMVSVSSQYPNSCRIV